MADDINLEKLGDESTPEELAEVFANAPDLTVGNIAGMGEVAKELLCGGVRESSGETDGQCKIFNAAINEFNQRDGKEKQR